MACGAISEGEGDAKKKKEKKNEAKYVEYALNVVSSVHDTAERVVG